MLSVHFAPSQALRETFTTHYSLLTTPHALKRYLIFSDRSSQRQGPMPPAMASQTPARINKPSAFSHERTKSIRKQMPIKSEIVNSKSEEIQGPTINDKLPKCDNVC